MFRDFRQLTPTLINDTFANFFSAATIIQNF